MKTSRKSIFSIVFSTTLLFVLLLLFNFCNLVLPSFSPMVQWYLIGELVPPAVYCPTPNILKLIVDGSTLIYFAFLLFF